MNTKNLSFWNSLLNHIFDSSFQTDAAKMALHHNRTDQSEWNLINHFQNLPIADNLAENKIQVPFWKTIFNDSESESQMSKLNQNGFW